MLESLFTLLFGISCPIFGPALFTDPIGVVLAVQQQPDPTKARPRLDDADKAKLQSVRGKPRWQVLQILGHPASVSPSENGMEYWTYTLQEGQTTPRVVPSIGIRVLFKDGVCIRLVYFMGC